MKVKEAVEKMGGLTEGKHAYRIGFINVREEEDETELDTDCIEDLGIWRGNPRPFNDRDESAACFYHTINLPKA